MNSAQRHAHFERARGLLQELEKSDPPLSPCKIQEKLKQIWETLKITETDVSMLNLWTKDGSEQRLKNAVLHALGAHAATRPPKRRPYDKVSESTIRNLMVFATAP